MSTKKYNVSSDGIFVLDDDGNPIASFKQIEGLPLVVLPEEKHSLLLRIADRIDEMAWSENTSMFDTYIKEIREYAAQQKGTYTEEQIREAMRLMQENYTKYGNWGTLKHSPDAIIQSLQPKRFPVVVELEIENMGSKGAYYCSSMADWQLKVNPDNTIHPVNVYYDTK